MVRFTFHKNDKVCILGNGVPEWARPGPGLGPAWAFILEANTWILEGKHVENRGHLNTTYPSLLSCTNWELLRFKENKQNRPRILVSNTQP